VYPQIWAWSFQAAFLGGKRSSTRLIIRSASITASVIAAFSCGEGNVLSNWASFRTARIAAMIPMTRLRLSSIWE
jgi:hypothetical protein